VAVAVGRDVSVGEGGSVLIGLGVAVGGGATVGGTGVASNPHDSRKIASRVKVKMRRVMFRMILPKLPFSTRDIWRRHWLIHTPRPCLNLLQRPFPV